MATQKLRRTIPTNSGGLLLSELLPSVPDHLWWVMPESCEGLTEWTPAQEIQVDFVRETRSEVGCILLPSGVDPRGKTDTIPCLAYAEWDSAWATSIQIEFALLSPVQTEWGVEFTPLPADFEHHLR
jgi:hypothetical protein